MSDISMQKVSSTSVDRFLEKDFVENAEREASEKLYSAIRYGIAYKEAFGVLEDQTRAIHVEAVKMREVLYLSGTNLRSLLWILECPCV